MCLCLGWGKSPSVKERSGNAFGFTFSGKSGDYEVISLCDVLDGKIDARVFRNAIVLVGAYAPGMQDSYNVAVQRGQQMYGVEIHANIIERVLSAKSFLRERASAGVRV